LGAFFALSVVALLISLYVTLFPGQDYFPWLDPLLMIIALVFIIDFVTLGWLKRIPYFSKVYYPVYRVMSWLTLSPLYRRIYYGLISNLPKWKAAFGMISFIVVSVVSGYKSKIFSWLESGWSSFLLSIFISN